MHNKNSFFRGKMHGDLELMTSFTKIFQMYDMDLIIIERLSTVLLIFTKQQESIFKSIFVLNIATLVVSMMCVSKAWSIHSEKSYFVVTQKNSEVAEALVTFASGYSSSFSTQRGAAVLQCGATFQQNWYGMLRNNMLSILKAALDAESKGLRFFSKDCFHPILNFAPYDYYSRINHEKAEMW